MKHSFKKVFNKTGLPTIKIKIDNCYYLFLLDTGSDISYINEDIIKKHNFEIIGYKQFVDYSSCIRNINMYNVIFSINNILFNDMFGENICCDSFDVVKKYNNIELHGIIGSKTMEKIGIKIDFKSMIISV